MDITKLTQVQLEAMRYMVGKKQIATISRSKYYSTVSNGTNVDVTYQSKHEVLAGCTNIQLLYGNFYLDDRTTDLSPFDLNVSIYYKGVNYPLTFNQKLVKRFELGEMHMTDPLRITMEEKDVFWVRSHVLQKAGEKHPRGLLLFSSPNNEGAVDGDVTTTAGAVTPPGQTAYGYTPLALYADPIPSAGRFKTVGICGSSSSTGTGRANTVLEGHPQGELGFLQIGALRAGWGYVSAGMNGQKASDFAQYAKRKSRLRMVENCDVVIVQYASNDLANNATTFEKLRSDLLTIHRMFWDMGIDTAQVTVNPRTNSTDNWTTLENQTPINANFAAGPNSTRARFNEWVMSNKDGIVGIDTNKGWESSPNSGLWIVSPQKATDDGIHPNTYGHDNAAANAVRNFLLGRK